MSESAFIELPPMKGEHTNAVVNINGTSAAVLIDQWLEVRAAAQLLEAALSKAVPHGRDYQTVGGTDGLRYRRDETLHRLMRRFAANVNRYAYDSAIELDRQNR